jgi:hypothetical protein
MLQVCVYVCECVTRATQGDHTLPVPVVGRTAGRVPHGAVGTFVGLPLRYVLWMWGTRHAPVCVCVCPPPICVGAGDDLTVLCVLPALAPSTFTVSLSVLDGTGLGNAVVDPALYVAPWVQALPSVLGGNACHRPLVRALCVGVGGLAWTPCCCPAALPVALGACCLYLLCVSLVVAALQL